MCACCQLKDPAFLKPGREPPVSIKSGKGRGDTRAVLERR